MRVAEGEGEEGERRDAGVASVANVVFAVTQSAVQTISSGSTPYPSVRLLQSNLVIS